MKNLAAIAIVVLVSVVAQAEGDGRALAGQSDFSPDYLAKVTDERAADEIRREKDRKDHDKYLKMINRSR